MLLQEFVLYKFLDFLLRKISDLYIPFEERNKNEEEKELSTPTLYPVDELEEPKKRILPVHLSCPCSTGKYVVFK